MYLNGEFVERNISNAILYFEDAIKINNSVYSLYNLARIYYFGVGVKEDMKKSILLLEKAAQNHLFFAIILPIQLFYDKNDEEMKKKTKININLLKDFGEPIYEFFISCFNTEFKNESFSEKLFLFFRNYDLVFPFTNDIYIHFLRFMGMELPSYLSDKEIKPNNEACLNLTEKFYEGFDI